MRKTIKQPESKPEPETKIVYVEKPVYINKKQGCLSQLFINCFSSLGCLLLIFAFAIVAFALIANF